MNVIGLLVLLAAGGAVFALAIVAFTAWTLTHPPRRTYAWAVARNVPGDPAEVRMPDGLPVEFSSWTFTSRGLELPVWDIAGRNPDGPVALVTHGWGDSRVIALARLPALLMHCRRVVMWDLPGHGDAQGSCTLGTREVDDLQRLLERVDGDAPVVLYGSSLGAGVSIAVAAANGAESRIAAVIAEAPYRVPRAPAERVMRLRGLPWRWNLPIAMALLGVRLGYGLSWVRRGRGAGGFDRVQHAARLRVPLLVIHGSEDEVCPPIEGRDIAAAVLDGRGRFVLVEGAAHNNLWTEDRFIPVCAGAVAEFLDQVSSPVA